MDLGKDIPELTARCYKQPCTLGDFATRVEAFMADFVSLHPMFSDLCLVGRNDADSPPLSPDLSNLRPWIEQRGWERKPPTGSEYTHRDAQGRLTEASEGGMGFRVAFGNKQGFDHKASLLITQGSPSLGNEVKIRLARLHPEFHQGELPRQLMDVVLRHWNVGHASYSTPDFHELVGYSETQEQFSQIVFMGWLTYVDDPTVAEALPPDLPCRRTGDGVLFEIGHGIADLADPQRIALGLAVREALRAAGKLKFNLTPSTPISAR